MVRMIVRVSVVGALIAAAAFTAVPAQAVQPHAAISAVGTEGLQELSQCLNSNPNLLAMMVVDESGSLTQTDPENKRAAILAEVVTALGSLAAEPLAGQPRRVDLAVATFAGGYTPLIPWTTLTPISAAEIGAQIRRDIPALNQGRGGTNHPEALAGGRNQLAQASAAFGADVPPCKLMLMFTDGQLNIGSDAENRAAAVTMCKVKGVVSGVRSDGVTLVDVMLFDRARLPKFTPEARALLTGGALLLQAMAEGTAKGVTCGTVPIPATSRSGLYLEGSADALAALFAGAIAQGSGGTPVAGVKGSPASFTIDPGIASFRTVAFAPQGFTLKAPDGSELSGVPGAGTGPVAGTQARVGWANQTVTIDVPVTPAANGTWTLTRPGQSDPVGLYLFSGLQLKLNDSKLIAGAPSVIEGQVIDSSGKAHGVDSFGSSALTVTALDSAGSGTPVPLSLKPDGSFSGAFTPQGGQTSTTFDLTLNLTTKSGLALTPVSRRLVQPVRLSDVYPTVTPASLTLSALEGRDGQARGTITLTGSTQGPTRVCVGAPTLSEPADPTDFTVTPDAQACYDLGTDESKAVDVAVGLRADPIDGQINGSVPLTLTSASGTNEAAVTQDVGLPLTFVTVRPLNQAARVGVVAALALLGAVLPLLVLWFLSWRSSRLSLKGLQMARIPVRVASGGEVTMLHRLDGKGALLEPADFSYIPSDLDRARSWAPGPERLRGLTPLNPFGTPHAVVEVSDGQVVISGGSPNTAKSGRRAGVSLDPSNDFYLLASAGAVRSSAIPQVAAVSVDGPDHPFGMRSTVSSPVVAVADEVVTGTLVAFIKPEYGGSAATVEKLVATIMGSSAVGRGIDELRKAPPPPKASKPRKTTSSSAQEMPTAAPSSAGGWSAPDPGNPFGSPGPAVQPGAGPGSPPRGDAGNPFA